MGAISLNAALTALEALGDPARAASALAYHKAPRRYLGVPVPQITDLAKGWRAGLDLPGRLSLASGLWASDVHEARVAAAKLLTQARIAGDEAVWQLIASWVPQFDAWAIADHVCDAGGRRLLADPSRLDQVEGWTRSDHMWSRRAALVITLPWTKQNFPKPEDLAVRDRVLGWCAAYAEDKDWFIQNAVAGWLRDLSRHDIERADTWLTEHGPRLKSWARKEAAKYLGPTWSLPEASPETEAEPEPAAQDPANL